MPSVRVVDGITQVQQLEAFARTAKRKQMQMMPMLPTARPARTLAKSVVAAALVLPALLPGLAYADQPRPPPSVPAAIRVPVRNVPFLLGHATVTQNYTCQPSSTGYRGA